MARSRSTSLRASSEHGRRDDSRHMTSDRAPGRGQAFTRTLRAGSRLAASRRRDRVKPSGHQEEASAHDIAMSILLSELIRSHIGFVWRDLLPAQGRQARPIGFVCRNRLPTRCHLDRRPKAVAERSRCGWEARRVRSEMSRLRFAPLDMTEQGAVSPLGWASAAPSPGRVLA